MDIVFATNNKHKIEEIRQIIGIKHTVFSLSDYKIEEEIPETRNTLEGNAIQKAEYIYNKYNISCFADDTGLEVEALGGRPGVYSARYAGENCSFQDNINKLLFELEGVENRESKFRTVIALIIKGEVKTFEGQISGIILPFPSGNKGFGYDALFKPNGWAKSFAEMSMAEKNNISHRGLAVKQLAKYLGTL